MSKDILALLADGQDAIFGIDLEHRVVLWNSGAQKLLGWSAEDVLGKPCYEIIQGCSDEAGRCAQNCMGILQARRWRVPSGQTLHMRTKDGIPKWLFVSHVLVPSENPELPVLVHILRDATSEVEARQLVHHFTRFLEQASLQAAPAEKDDPPAQNLLGLLSPREAEVLRLLSQGYGAEAIAARLYLSPTTVRNHIQHILSKLYVHTRAEAIVYAFRNGLP